MSQTTLNFNTDSIQLQLWRPQSVSENQEDNTRLKWEIASWLLSKSDLLATKAKLEENKFTPLVSQA